MQASDWIALAALVGAIAALATAAISTYYDRRTARAADQQVRIANAKASVEVMTTAPLLHGTYVAQRDKGTP